MSPETLEIASCILLPGLIVLGLVLTRFKFGLRLAGTLAVILAIYRAFTFIQAAAVGHDNIVPVELSHVTVFVMGAIAIAGIPQLEFFGGYMGVICGLAYSLAAIVSPGKVLSTLTAFEQIQGLVIHSLLLLLGMVFVFGARRYKWRAIGYSAVGIACYFVFGILVSEGVLYGGVNTSGYVIVKLVHGQALSYFGVEVPQGSHLALLVSACTFLLMVVLCLAFFLLSRAWQKRLGREQLEFGIYPLVNSAVSSKRNTAKNR